MPANPEESREAWTGSGREGAWRRRTAAAAVGSLVLGTALLAAAASWGRPSAPSLGSGRLGGLVGLQAADPCSSYPFLRLDEATHKNLGNRGPDAGAEGIVIRGRDLGQGETGKEIELRVNAVGPYEINDPRWNGLSGQYGLISVMPGTHVEVTFEVVDRATQQPMHLPQVHFTFFDLDMEEGGGARESITVAGLSDAYFMHDTEVVHTANPDGSHTFAASQVGTGHDNPADPLLLTAQQKNRCVTLKFTDFTRMRANLSASPGTHVRGFMFVGRPSVLCARTDGQGGGDSIDSLVTTTTTTAAAGGAGGASCWFQLFGKGFGCSAGEGSGVTCAFSLLARGFWCAEESG